MEIQKIMYGLPQSGNISNDKLKQYLVKFGYDPATITPEFWRHQTRPFKVLLGLVYYMSTKLISPIYQTH